jgi:DNA-binding transcriptional MerR regulator
MSHSEPLWTIAELGALVARALAVDYAGQTNGQVRDVPDQRTIRYYTTLGLLDRPAQMRGRTALYGRRHLLQVTAIKRLQAAGRSLAEIQQQLLGLSTAALTELAQLPADLETLPASASAPGENVSAPPERSDRPFWSTPPAPVGTGASVQTLHSVRLAEGAALLLTSTEPLNAETIEAIQSAAAPLLALLEAQGLVRPRQERGT